MVQKILYFLGGSAWRQKCDTHPANAIIVAGRVGRGLTKEGGSLVGADDSLFSCGGDTTCHDDGNCIIVAWEKCLWGSIIGGKTNVGCGFWQGSGMHKPHQRATMLLKPGVSDINVVKYWSQGKFPLNALRWEIGNVGGGVRDVVVCCFCLFVVAYVELLCVFWFCGGKFLSAAPTYIVFDDNAALCKMPDVDSFPQSGYIRFGVKFVHGGMLSISDVII
jgi:hypothetical protein